MRFVREVDGDENWFRDILNNNNPIWNAISYF